MNGRQVIEGMKDMDNSTNNQTEMNKMDKMNDINFDFDFEVDEKITTDTLKVTLEFDTTRPLTPQEYAQVAEAGLTAVLKETFSIKMKRQLCNSPAVEIGNIIIGDAG